MLSVEWNHRVRAAGTGAFWGPRPGLSPVQSCSHPNSSAPTQPCSERPIQIPGSSQPTTARGSPRPASQAQTTPSLSPRQPPPRLSPPISLCLRLSLRLFPTPSKNRCQGGNPSCCLNHLWLCKKRPHSERL